MIALSPANHNDYLRTERDREKIETDREWTGRDTEREENRQRRDRDRGIPRDSPH